MKYTIDDAIRKLSINIDPTVSGGVLEACNIALDVLMELKEKEQKTGKWIFHKSFDNGRKNCNECIECSQCHIWLGHDCYAKMPYCPNCGARMEAENDK